MNRRGNWFSAFACFLLCLMFLLTGREATILAQPISSNYLRQARLDQGKSRSQVDSIGFTNSKFISASEFSKEMKARTENIVIELNTNFNAFQKDFLPKLAAISEQLETVGLKLTGTGSISSGKPSQLKKIKNTIKSHFYEITHIQNSYLLKSNGVPPKILVKFKK
ncbi:hypothetical protein HYY75_08325 [bacterium]|nr:hypothetical protein [bacterium]